MPDMLFSLPTSRKKTGFQGYWRRKISQLCQNLKGQRLSRLCHSHDALTTHVSWQSSFQMFQGEKAVSSTFVCLFHTVSSSPSKVLVLFFYLVHNDCDKWYDCDCQAHVLFLCLSLACVQFTWSFQCKYVGWLLYKPLWPLWLCGSFLCKLAISSLIVAMCITRI